MNKVEAVELIVSTFITGWAGATPVALDNETYRPNSPTEVPNWVRLHIQHFDPSPGTIGKKGNRRFQRRGNIYIQVFTPVDKGTKASSTYAETARNVFEGERVGELSFYASPIREIGPTPEGWYQENVEVPFDYYETR